MSGIKSKSDRRLHDRMEFDATALVFHRGAPVGELALHNLSAGGAWITGHHDLKRGNLVHLVMKLEKDPLSLTASVHDLRRNGNDGGIAVTFPCLSADQEDVIQDAMLRRLVREDVKDRAPVLVFEPRARVRHELEAEIRSLGLLVQGVSDLTEAIQDLEDDDSEYSALVVHSAVYDPAVMDVIEFFARDGKIRTIILPELSHELPYRVQDLSKLRHVAVPPFWNRETLRELLA